MRLFYKISYIVNFISAVFVLVYYNFIIISEITEVGDTLINPPHYTDKLNKPDPANNYPTYNQTQNNYSNEPPPIISQDTTNSTNKYSLNNTDTTNSTNNDSQNNTESADNRKINLNPKLRLFEDNGKINEINLKLNKFSEYVIDNNNHTNKNEVEHLLSELKENTNSNRSYDYSKNITLLASEKISFSADRSNKTDILINDKDSEINHEKKFTFTKERYRIFLQESNENKTNNSTIPICLQNFMDFRGCGEKILQDVLIIIAGLILIINGKNNFIFFFTKFNGFKK